MINRVLTVLLACLFAGAVVSARAADPVPADVADSLRQMLESPADGLKVATIEPSEIEGMYAVQLVDGPLVYANRSLLWATCSRWGLRVM